MLRAVPGKKRLTRSRFFAMASAAVLVTVLAGMPASAVTRTVEIDDDSFGPGTMSARVGDTVHWTRASGSNGDHNVAEDDNSTPLFRSGDPTDQAINYSRVFSAGAFYYQCEVHGGDMDGFVRVPVSIGGAPTGLPFTVRWAKATQTGSSFDVQYRIGSGAWQNWRSNGTTFDGVFGKNARPVKVSGTKTYSFRARSQRGSSVSRWSPVKSFSP
jgi:plastocyanin